VAIQTNSKLLADAVFEGGGVKGIALVGAVALLRERIHWSIWQVHGRGHCRILIGRGVYRGRIKESY